MATEIIKSISVEDFKAMHNTNTLEVVRSPKTQKLFISVQGKSVGAVSAKYDSAKPKQFTLLSDGTTQVWVLCNRSVASVVETL